MSYTTDHMAVRTFGYRYAEANPGLESPLSGEWADGLTPQTMIDAAGVTLPDNVSQEVIDYIVEGLCDTFETAYHEAQEDEGEYYHVRDAPSGDEDWYSSPLDMVDN